MNKNKVILFSMALPALIILFGVILYPLISGIMMSFETARQSFTLQNYIYIFNSYEFQKSIGATFLWIVGSLPLTLLLGLIFALFLNQHIPGRGFLRALIMVAWVMPETVAGVIWNWLLLMPNGTFNDILQSILRFQVPWLTYSTTALPVAFLINGWKGFGWTMIIFLAALQSIDPELYEAAKVDGATSFKSFIFITLPLLVPAIILNAIFRTVWYMNQFALIMTLTGGGPGYATTTFPVYIYKQAFSWGNFGVATAAGSIALVVSMVLLIAYLFAGKKMGVDILS